MHRALWVAVLLLSLAVSAVASPLRVACLGDSLTEGDGDDRGGGYPARIQSKLQAGSKVANLGHSGQTAEMVLNGYERFPSQVTQALAFHPDVACVWVGSNDLWYLYEYNNPTPADEARDVSNFRNRVRAIVDRLRKANVKVVLALLDDQSKRPVALAGKAFSGISRAEMQRMSKQVKAYNDVLRAEAARAGAGIADFSSSKIFTDRATLNDDGNHPNGRGYDRIAEVWWAAIARGSR